MYTKEIVNNELLLDLKNDIVFKTVFLSKEGRGLLCEIISKVLNIDYDLLMDKLVIINNEIPDENILNKKSLSDIVCLVDNKQFIIEMNKFKTKKILNKNAYYLFSTHVNKLNNKNDYGIEEYTFLINFDNYDILNKNDLIYESMMVYTKYNICMYPNIKCLHINLDYVKNKYYNKDDLNELESLFVIFVEHSKNSIKNTIKNSNVERVVDYMDRLKVCTENFVTYDKEEFDRSVMEEVYREREKLRFERKRITLEQNKVSKEQINISKEKDKISKEQDKISKEQDKISKEYDKIFNEKKNLIKQFKLINYTDDKISKIFNISIDELKKIIE